MENEKRTQDDGRFTRVLSGALYGTTLALVLGYLGQAILSFIAE